MTNYNQDNNILYGNASFSNFIENFKFVISSGGLNPTKDFDYLRQAYSICLAYNKTSLVEESFIRELLDNKQLIQYQEDLLRVLYKLRGEEKYRHDYFRISFLQGLLYKLIIKVLILNPDNARKINNSVLYLKEFLPIRIDEYIKATDEKVVNNFVGLAMQSIDYAAKICKTITYLKVPQDIKFEYLQNAIKFFIQLFQYYKFPINYENDSPILATHKKNEEKRFMKTYRETLAELAYYMLYKIDVDKLDKTYMLLIRVLIEKSNCFYYFENGDDLSWLNYDDVYGGAQLLDFDFYRYRLIWSCYMMILQNFDFELEKNKIRNYIEMEMNKYNLAKLKDEYYSRKFKSAVLSLNIQTVSQFANCDNKLLDLFKEQVNLLFSRNKKE